MLNAVRHSLRPTFILGTLLCLVLAGHGLAQEANLPELTLAQAIDMAQHNNASVGNASFETRRSLEQLASTKTQRYPQANIVALGGILLTKPKLTFDAGAFGDYAATGPIPAENTTIVIPRKLEGIVVGSATEALTSQYQLHLQVVASKLDLLAAREDEHRKRQETVNQVSKEYYDVVVAQSQLESKNASLPYYRESKRVAVASRENETNLKSDLLTADAQLIQAENQAADAADQLASKMETLNDALGRDVKTQFRVTGIESIDNDGNTLESLEVRALASRPDLKKARLKERSADYSARAETAGYIPSVSLSFDYFTTFNYTSTLPRDITSAGFLLSWQPWDWGKRYHDARDKRAQQAEAKITVSSTERTVLMDVRGAWRDLQSSRRSLALSEANLLSSRQKLAELQSAVEQQQKLNKDLFSAQSDLASADYAHDQALSTFWQARAALKKAIGDD